MDYLDLIRQFYDKVSYPDRYIKMEQLRQANDEAISIKKFNPLEYPGKILAMRRLLLGLLPFWGYQERDELNQRLNLILDACRNNLLNLPISNNSFVW